ncbi:N-acetylmuramoyl-L-alanine amidase [Alkalihalophilus lindianensis]|uniref:N-acetylmuramoyl-L-alanine amidase n=1 Tax=Alkalihalophilus lindianensis TaxID=1630542 RepID=A0ABU3XF01_9BACI|nr:N-acetylmuramoyl-L-alanine amidase [Alkalihalophilus lindianensis]MDV2686465.1 N-acetylmuramoyl-L-alanine amidase [Alkalihalophilus lindianensis]
MKMRKIKIMIDPGHGGRDPGAVANGLVEKELALTIARNLRTALLNHHNVEVRLTRDRDIFLTLEERARLANAWGADCFISIHINAGGGTGFETFIHPNAGKATQDIQKILHPEIKNRLTCADRGLKKANFAVLRLTKMPAILTENLFLDHTEDANQLKDTNVIHAITQGHLIGLQKALALKPIPKSTASTNTKPNTTTPTYRLRIDGKQVGAYQQKDNLIEHIQHHLHAAKKIELERI